ncbi:MAG: host-nuclease inhibitor Gam family protein [Myxococcales bacterium]|jgi:phage host-nuclease inhibitor protein Gam|nr:host-nuclease inhibitor Gam family protein [Myxococcales bacterium]
MTTTEKKTKAKKSILPLPKSREEANAMIAEIAMNQQRIARLEADTNARIDAIKEKSAEALTPLKDAIDLGFASLRTWATLHRAELLKGGGKTATFTHGEISWRMSKPKVSIKKEKEVLALLQELEMDEYIREKLEIDKEAILKKPSPATSVPGISIVQEEEIIVEPYQVEFELPSTKATAGEAVSA